MPRCRWERFSTPYVWESTASLVSDVQQWLSAPAINFGWELVNADETTARNFRAFYSRDTATAALHPQLQITYTDANIAGDFNGDGHLTSADIQAMITALTHLRAYQSAHDLSNVALLAVGDVDQNQVVNNADLQALLARLGSGRGKRSNYRPRTNNNGAGCNRRPVRNALPHFVPSVGVMTNRKIAANEPAPLEPGDKTAGDWLIFAQSAKQNVPVPFSKAVLSPGSTAY